MSEKRICCHKDLGDDPENRHVVSLDLFVSDCCGKPVKVVGEGVTHWYACTGCGEGANLVPKKDQKP